MVRYTYNQVRAMIGGKIPFMLQERLENVGLFPARTIAEDGITATYDRDAVDVWIGRANVALQSDQMAPRVKAPAISGLVPR